jgi:hypothetical protein
LCSQATLSKLASQFFGAGFGRPWVAKILTKISKGDMKWFIGSLIGNKPNKQKDIWHDQYFSRINWGHKPNRPLEHLHRTHNFIAGWINRVLKTPAPKEKLYF